MSRTVTEWVLKLVDDITSPMRSVHQVCEDTAGSAGDVADKLEDVHESAGRVPGAFAQIAASAFAFNQVSDAIGRVNSEIKNITAGQVGFETAMAKANTMAELQGNELSEVTKEIREMSENVPKLRTELADGLYQVVSNSVPKDNWISFLEDSAKASVGGAVDLGEVIKVTSTLIKNYGLAWNESGLIQDKIQKTAKLGVTNFSELGAALPRVAGNAKTLGVNIDELLGSFATLTGVSGNTAEVSTQLGAIFTALVKPSTEAAKTAAAIGIQFDAAAIQAAGGMQNYFNLLQTRVKSYAAQTGELSTEIYGRLFGSAEALRAFLPLTGEIGDVWKEKSGEVANAAGTIEQAFETMSETTEARTEMMQNRFSNFKDHIVEAVSKCLPFITVVGDAVTGVSSFGFALYGLSIVFKRDLWSGVWSGIRAMGKWITTTASAALKSRVFAAANSGITRSFRRMGIEVGFMQGELRGVSMASLGFRGSMIRATLAMVNFGTKGIWAGIKGIGALILSLVTGGTTSAGFAAVASASFATFKLSAVTACRAVGLAIKAIPIIGWIAAIISALVALGVYFYNTSATFRGFLWGLWESIKAVFGGIWKFLYEVCAGYLHLLKGVFNPANWFDSDYKFSDGIDRIKNAAAGFGKEVGDAFSKGRAEGMADFADEKAKEKAEKGGFKIVGEEDDAGGETETGGLQIGSGETMAPGVVNVSGSDAGVVNLSGNGSGATGGGSGGRNITMNVTFNQTFHADGNGNINNLAEIVMQKITGVLRDARIATT